MCGMWKTNIYNFSWRMLVVMTLRCPMCIALYTMCLELLWPISIWCVGHCTFFRSTQQEKSSDANTGRSLERVNTSRLCPGIQFSCYPHTSLLSKNCIAWRMLQMRSQCPNSLQHLNHQSIRANKAIHSFSATMHAASSYAENQSCMWIGSRIWQRFWTTLLLVQYCTCNITI